MNATCAAGRGRRRPVVSVAKLLLLGLLIWAGCSGPRPSVTPAHVPAAEPVEMMARSPEPTLHLGDAAPDLSVTWVGRGQDDSPAVGRAASEPAPTFAPGRITVIEFWASWCPVSRRLLAHQDSLLAEGAYPGVRIAAISQEHPAHIATFAERTGWHNLLLGADPDKVALRDYLIASFGGERDMLPIPFAFIVGDDPGGRPGRILWKGACVDPAAAEPLAAFEDALRAIRTDTYDLAAAQQAERDARRRERALGALPAMLAQRDLQGIERALAVLEAGGAPGRTRGDALQVLNSVAWQLATADSARARDLGLAERACHLALAAGGAEDPFFMDTYARLFFERGEYDRAVEIQATAVELADGMGFADEAREALGRYREAAGLPLLEGSATRAVVWRGSLNDVASALGSGAEGLLVGPAEMGEAWRKELEAIRDRFYSGMAVRASGDLTAADRERQVLTLYGTPQDNPILSAVLSEHGIALAEDGVHIGAAFLPAEHPVLIAALPNPWHPELPVRVYTAAREDDAHNLNRFFHGPRAMVVGRWDEGEPANLYDQNFDEPAGVPVRLTMAKARLTCAELIEELRALHELLRKGYAGYPDIAWELSLQGQSWTSYTAAFEESVAVRPTWSWDEAYDWLVSYLRPVQDTHFQMVGLGPPELGSAKRRDRFIDLWTPYFAEGGVVRDPGSGRCVYVKGGERIPIEPPPVALSPHVVEIGRAYLFPTLPLSGTEGRAECFLVGVFSLDELPPAQLALGRVGGGPELRLPVHRGRLAEAPIERGGWALREAGEDQATPVLEVRTMDPRALSGLSETADSLRSLPEVLLDLRHNPGGSDMAAMQWCQRFSGQGYAMGAFTYGVRNEVASDWAYASHITLPVERLAGPRVPSAESPYAGRLRVLIDKGVASSGETFTMLAGQVPGAVLLGENTAGCVNYGNVEVHGPLPYTRIRLAFGRSRFALDWMRPNREGVGFFPDDWLDTADPVAALGL